GPDLNGVTDRRTRPWLTSWIRSPQRLIERRDGVAVTLFEKFRRERMPDLNLTDEDIQALLDYFAAGGPMKTGAGGTAPSPLAAPSGLTAGGKLFFGAAPTRSGGAPCASCHSVRVDRTVTGGTFAGELTHAYTHFQDAALTEFLRRPCSPRAFPNEADAPLTDS